MDFRFLKSRNRLYYIFASLRFQERPDKIYNIVHSEDYLNISKERRIYDDYFNFISRSEYKKKK